MVEKNWYPDPLNNNRYRWFDGKNWTAHVKTGSGGEQMFDPPPATLPPPEKPDINLQDDEQQPTKKKWFKWVVVGAVLIIILPLLNQTNIVTTTEKNACNELENILNKRSVIPENNTTQLTSLIPDFTFFPNSWETVEASFGEGPTHPVFKSPLDTKRNGGNLPEEHWSNIFVTETGEPVGITIERFQTSTAAQSADSLALRTSCNYTRMDVSENPKIPEIAVTLVLSDQKNLGTIRQTSWSKGLYRTVIWASSTSPNIERTLTPIINNIVEQQNRFL